MTVAELLERVRSSRVAWDALVASLSDHALVSPRLRDGWSVKDVIAHIAWFEREMTGICRARAFVGSDLWALPPHERNAAIQAENQARDLADVRADAAAAWGDLLSALATLSDRDLVDPASFPGMPPDWVPLEIIAGNTYEHYPAHAVSVGAQLGGGGG